MEFFNILNHPNFGSPNGDLSSPLFGRSPQTLANGLGSGGPRSIQVALNSSERVTISTRDG